jgi:hypothetical protein
VSFHYLSQTQTCIYNGGESLALSSRMMRSKGNQDRDHAQREIAADESRRDVCVCVVLNFRQSWKGGREHSFFLFTISLCFSGMRLHAIFLVDGFCFTRALDSTQTTPTGIIPSYF